LSPDHEFAPIGARSKINYREDFNTYKKILITTAGRKRTKKIITWFNQVVFSHVPKQDKVPMGQPYDEDAINAAMRALEETSDEDLPANAPLDEDIDERPDEETHQHGSTSSRRPRIDEGNSESEEGESEQTADIYVLNAPKFTAASR
jgi:hypothetical protein